MTTHRAAARGTRVRTAERTTTAARAAAVSAPLRTQP